MKQVYPTFILKNENDFLVFVPDMDIYTEGTDMADAISMARDAIGLKGITMQDNGDALPDPSSQDVAIESARKDADEDADFSTGILTYVDIDFDEYRRKTENRVVKKNCTLPSWLNEAATAAGINFSQVLQEALKEKLGVA